MRQWTVQPANQPTNQTKGTNDLYQNVGDDSARGCAHQFRPHLAYGATIIDGTTIEKWRYPKCQGETAILFVYDDDDMARQAREGVPSSAILILVVVVVVVVAKLTDWCATNTLKHILTHSLIHPFIHSFIRSMLWFRVGSITSFV